MQMPKVHSREERKLILLNMLNQPVGPTEDVVTELSSFLGTLARNATLCPFGIFYWRNMDTKKDLWDYTKEKYIIPDTAKAWTLVTIREAWRSHRSELKRTYYDPYDNDEVRISKKPCHITECQRIELLKYWKSEKFKKILETNTKNRKKLINSHTAGKKSFAVIHNRLEKDKETVSSKELFVVTRTRNPSCVYKAFFENTASTIEQSCGFPRDRREFFAKLGGVGKIITIFILNLAPSQGTIPHKRILRKLAPLVRDSYVISLVSHQRPSKLMKSKGMKAIQKI